MDAPATINLGNWTEDSIDSLLDLSQPLEAAARIVFISASFLGTPYGESTLAGGDDNEERLVINLAELDCFTFIDYVEALRRSRNFQDFIMNTALVRYGSGSVRFSARNHFFSDWIARNTPFLFDATAETGGRIAAKVTKQLNKKDDGALFVPGIPVIERDLAYIPVSGLRGILSRLQNGDYLGIYSPSPGLDVTHTGIVIRTGEHLLFRHASSMPGIRKVVEQDLAAYLADKPGIIVLRPC